MYKFRNYISAIFLFALLLPTAIQVVHAFEKHEHTVCTSINDDHFHEKELECSLLHYQLQVFSYTTASNYAVIPLHFYKTTYNEQPQVLSVVYTDKKNTRGPPYFTA